MQRKLKPLLTVVLLGLLTRLAVAQQGVAPPPVQPRPAPQPAPVAPPAAQPQPIAPPKAAPVVQPAPVAQPAPAANGVAATVNGQPIPEVAVQRALKAVPPAKHAEARPEIINFLIDNALLDQYVAAQGVNVDAPEVETRLGEMRKQLEKQKLDYQKVLADMMLTEQELRNHILAELRWEKFVNAQANEKVMRDTFDRAPEMFDGSLVRARHILLTPNLADAKAVEQSRQQLAAWKQQIEQSVAGGLAKLPATADNLAREKERMRLTDESFAAIAKEKSACPSSKQGGDVDWFPRAGAMVEPFAKAAFALKPFQMTDVVQTQFGLHLILVTDRKAGKAGVKFEEAKDEVKDVLAGRLRENICEQMRARAKIVR
ncbi:MAG: peptidylprolyl isomerase [Planctomycetia bacterium]|nr:peptidylprolyl isomerase [Planctomycetia bacterium]